MWELNGSKAQWRTEAFSASVDLGRPDLGVRPEVWRGAVVRGQFAGFGIARTHSWGTLARLLDARRRSVRGLRSPSPRRPSTRSLLAHARGRKRGWAGVDYLRTYRSLGRPANDLCWFQVARLHRAGYPTRPNHRRGGGPGSSEPENHVPVVAGWFQHRLCRDGASPGRLRCGIPRSRSGMAAEDAALSRAVGKRSHSTFPRSRLVLAGGRPIARGERAGGTAAISQVRELPDAVDHLIREVRRGLG